MDEARRRRLTERAHAVWESEGRPEGQAERHWATAEEELRAEEGGGAAAEAPALEPARTARELGPIPGTRDELTTPDVGTGDEPEVRDHDVPAAMPAGDVARTARKSTARRRKADGRVRP